MSESGLFGSGYSREELDRALTAAAPVLARGPLGHTERLYLYWVARDLFQFSGDLVELGAFIGASTQVLAAGIKDNPRRQGRPFRLETFDIFYYDSSWGGGLPELKTYHERLEVGVDFEDIFWENLGDLSEYVSARKGNILKIARYDRPIEVLFVDIMKSEKIMAHLANVYFSKLTVGSIVLNQDYMFGRLPFIKSFMEYFSEYFTFHDVNADCTTRFDLVKPWDVPPEETAAYRRLTLDQKKELHRRTMLRFGEHRRPILEESLRSFDDPRTQNRMLTTDLDSE
jgi:hypothetical protein